MEVLILQPIEFLERFPRCVDNESWLTILQEANEKQLLIAVDVETRMGVYKPIELRLFQ